VKVPGIPGCGSIHPWLRAYRDQAVCNGEQSVRNWRKRRLIFESHTDEEITADFPAAERKPSRNSSLDAVVQETKTKYRNRTVDLPDFNFAQPQQAGSASERTHGADQQSFRGSEVDEAALGRLFAPRCAIPYVVQEALEPVVDTFPGASNGHLEMQKMPSWYGASAFLSRQKCRVVPVG